MRRLPYRRQGFAKKYPYCSCVMPHHKGTTLKKRRSIPRAPQHLNGRPQWIALGRAGGG